jgi:hypothetical protein
MNRAVLTYRAILDRRNNEPAAGASRRGYVEDQIIRGVNAAGQGLRQKERKVVEPLQVRLEHTTRQAENILRPEFNRLVGEAGGRTYLLQMFSTGIHWLLIAGISIGEFAFNSQAFGLFGDAASISWLMAMGIAVGLPAAAHLLGVELRQARWTSLRLVAWSTLCLFVVGLLVGINHIRSTYLGIVSDLALADGAGAYPIVGIAYFSMNLFIFVAATVISYGAYDPVHRLAKVRARLIGAEAEILKVGGAVTQTQAVTGVRLEELSEAGLATLLHYRAINRRGRIDVPDYYDNEGCSDYKPDFMQGDAPPQVALAVPAATTVPVR